MDQSPGLRRRRGPKSRDVSSDAADDSDDQRETDQNKEALFFRRKNKIQTDIEELDRRVIATGLVSADDIRELTKQEKLDICAAFENSLGQTTMPGGSEDGPEEVYCVSPEIFSSQNTDEPVQISPVQVQVVRARPVHKPVQKLVQNSPVPVSPASGGFAINRENDETEINLSDVSIMSEDEDSSILNESPQPRPPLAAISANERSPGGIQGARMPASPMKLSQHASPSANQRPVTRQSPISQNLMEEASSDHGDNWLNLSPTNHSSAEIHQSERPMFTFECNEGGDWPRSPSPPKLCDKKRCQNPPLDPCPFFTPPGYCPREYTQVIINHLDFYLENLYRSQCSLPYRKNCLPVEVGRCHAGTLDAFRKRSRDMAERQEEYDDWRRSGGRPTTPELPPDAPRHEFPCDVHDFHAISANPIMPDSARKRKSEILEDFDEPEAKRFQTDEKRVLRSRINEPSTSQQVGVKERLSRVLENSLTAVKRNLSKFKSREETLAKVAKVESDDDDFESIPKRSTARPARTETEIVVDDEPVTKEEMGQCPMCQDMFCLDVLPGHAADCDGTSQADLRTHTQAFSAEGVGLVSPLIDDNGLGYRRLRNNRTVNTAKCMSCDEQISLIQYQAHSSQCSAKIQASLERQQRAKMMAEKIPTSPESVDSEVLASESMVIFVKCSVCNTSYPASLLPKHRSECLLARQQGLSPPQSQNFKIVSEYLDDNTQSTIEIDESESSEEELRPQTSRKPVTRGRPRNPVSQKLLRNARGRQRLKHVKNEPAHVEQEEMTSVDHDDVRVDSHEAEDVEEVPTETRRTRLRRTKR